MRIVFTSLLLALFFVSYAQDGSFDLFAWGNPGYEVTPTPQPVINEPAKILILGDGSVLQCYTGNNSGNNDFGMVKYDRDGAVVQSGFGTGGYVTTDFGGDDHVLAMTITAAGQIILAGRSDGQFAIARYNSDGSPDNSFDGDGKRLLNVGSNAQINAIVESGGVITVSGTANTGSHLDFALARFTSSGTLDGSFGTGGTTFTSINGSEDVINSMSLQSDGKLVVGGYTKNGSVAQFALARYNSNGTLDPNFDSDGIVVTSIEGTDDGVNGLAIQNSTQKIVAVGYAFNSGKYDFAIARYTSGGTLDGTFNGTGKTTLSIGSSNDKAYDVAIQPLDGKLLVAGTTQVDASTSDFAITRLSSDGTIDTDFGENPGVGVTTINFPPETNSDDDGYDISLGSGYIMFGGFSSNNLGTARVINSAAIILPVHIISFVASKKTGSVALNWQAANERGVDSYDVERSSDGIHFSKVGSVPGGVNNNYIKSYSFEDSHPASVNFYRLRIVNASGKIEYTSNVVAKFENITPLEVFPNPVQSNLNLQITQPKGKVNLQLFDITGRLVKASQLQSKGITISTSIDVSNLKKGIYLVKVNEEVVKFLKE